MTTFTLNEKQYNIPTTWEEINLGTYITLAELGNDLNTKYAFTELYVMRVLELLSGAESGDLDDLTIQELNDLTAQIDYLNTEPKLEVVQSINIDGIDYAFPEDLYHIKAGEYISIKTLQENEKNPSEFYLNLLSILLRPAKKVTNAETGKTKWVQEKFSVENLAFRKELYKKLPVTKVLGTINFFLNGKDISKVNTQDSTKEEQVVEKA